MNRAIEDLVLLRYGEQAWEAVRERAGLEDEGFLSQRLYDDTLTMRTVQSASEVFGVTPTAFLELLGEHWLLYTGRQGYGALFAMAGSTYYEFLSNVDAMHARVALSMPGARLPALQCFRSSEHDLTLHYRSERKGLAPLLVGILRGLGKMLEVEVDIRHESLPQAAGAHDIFHIRLGPRT